MTGFILRQCHGWLIGLVMLGAGIAQAEIPIVSVSDREDLLQHVGKPVIVTGVISHSEEAASGTLTVHFLEGALTLLRFKSDAIHFEKMPSALKAGDRVVVQGTLHEYRRQLQLKWLRPAQVRVLASGEAFPKNDVDERQVENSDAAAAGRVDEVDLPAESKPKPPVDWRQYFPQK